MFKIEIEGLTIYDDRYAAVEELKLINPKLNMEINQAGSLEFTLPSQNIWNISTFNGSIEADVRHRLVVKVCHNDDIVSIWKGRLMSVKSDMWNRKTIYCEGVLAWLNDAYPQDEYRSNGGVIGNDYPAGRYEAWSLLNDYLSRYSSYYNRFETSSTQYFKMAEKYRIQTRYTYVTTETDATAEDSIWYNYDPSQSIYDGIMGLKDKWGGYFVTTELLTGENIIQWWKDYWKGSTEEDSHANARLVDFGENLLDFVRTNSTEEAVTVLHPLGATFIPSGINGGIFGKIYPWEYWHHDHMGGITFYTGWWIEDDGDWAQTTNTRWVTSQTIKIETRTKYYYSGRIKGNYAKWAILDAHYVPISVGMSGAEQEKELDNDGNWTGNWVDSTKSFDREEITIPEEGKYIRFCWYKDPNNKDEDDHEIPWGDYSFIDKEATDAYSPEYTLTVAEVNGSMGAFMKLPTSLTNLYGSDTWIEKTVEWPDINVAKGLKSVATDYMQKVAFNSLSLEIKFVDMGFVNYDTLPASWSPVKLLDCVHVVSAPHGVDTYMYVTAVEIPFDNPGNITITLGSPEAKKLSDVTAANSKKMSRT